MHAGVKVESAIDLQIKQLAKRYKNEITLLKKVRSNTEQLIKTILTLTHDNRPELEGYQELFPIYYVLTQDFEMAWIAKNYFNRYSLRDVYNESEFESESPVSWDINLYWETARQGFVFAEEGMARRKSYLDAGKKVPFQISWIPFRLEDEQYNRDLIERPFGQTPDWIYNPSPEARYDRVDEEKNLAHLSFSMAAPSGQGRRG